jgi:hypothetical protein
MGEEAPAHVPDAIINAIRSRERDGALDPPERRGLQQRVEVLLFMFGAQRQLPLSRDATRWSETSRREACCGRE